MSAITVLTLLTVVLGSTAAVCVVVIIMQHEQIKDLNQYIKDLIQGLNR